MGVQFRSSRPAGPLTAPGGDERVALAHLAAAWGRDWTAARDALVVLLAAGGREWAATEVHNFGEGPVIDNEILQAVLDVRKARSAYDAAKAEHARLRDAADNSYANKEAADMRLSAAWDRLRSLVAG